MPDKYAPCKRGCCWSPQQVCGRNRTCPCHTDLRSKGQKQLDAMRAAYAEAERLAPAPMPPSVAPLFQEPTP